jgi:hypothetical protein
MLRLISADADDGGTGGIDGRRQFLLDRVQLGAEIAQARGSSATCLQDVEPLSALLEFVEQRGDAALVAPALRDGNWHFQAASFTKAGSDTPGSGAAGASAAASG